MAKLPRRLNVGDRIGVSKLLVEGTEDLRLKYFERVEIFAFGEGTIELGVVVYLAKNEIIKDFDTVVPDYLIPEKILERNYASDVEFHTDIARYLASNLDLIQLSEEMGFDEHGRKRCYIDVLMIIGNVRFGCKILAADFLDT